MKLKAVIDKILERILVVLMVVLVLDVLWQVISRYINKFLANNFDIQIPTAFYAFTDELAGFLLVWVALAGAAYATGKKQHLAIDLLSTKLSDTGKTILYMIINALIVIFAISVLIVGGFWLVYSRFYLGQVSAAMEIPIGLVYIIVPVSGLIISYYAVADFIDLRSTIKRITD
jgi:TRAP-type C4-dicarboxylate transport system permease small subunit